MVKDLVKVDLVDMFGTLLPRIKDVDTSDSAEIEKTILMTYVNLRGDIHSTYPKVFEVLEKEPIDWSLVKEAYLANYKGI